jgi:hypothetical protein
MIQNIPASVSVSRSDLSKKENKNLKTRSLRGEWPVKFTSTCKTPSNRTITYLTTENNQQAAQIFGTRKGQTQNVKYFRRTRKINANLAMSYNDQLQKM